LFTIAIDESLTLQRVESWTVAALKEYAKKRGLVLIGSKKVLATSEILVAHAVDNAENTNLTANNNNIVYPL